MLQGQEGPRFWARGVPWDDRGHLEEPYRGFEVLAAALAAVLLGWNQDLRGEGPSGGAASPFLRLLDEGGEGGERRLPVDRRSSASEPDLVEDPFSQPAQPSVKRGEVGLVRAPFGVLDGRAVTPGTREVRFGELLDDGD